MSDIISNRKRVSFTRKLRLVGLTLKENGPWWCLLLLTYYAASAVAHFVRSSIDRLRRAKHLPGLNSAALNKEIWEAWDWGAAGDKWNESEQ